MELCWKVWMKITKHNKITLREALLHFMISLYSSANIKQVKGYSVTIKKCIMYDKNPSQDI